MRTLLSEQLGIPFVDLSDLNLEREALEAIPETLQGFSLWLYFEGGELIVALPIRVTYLGWTRWFASLACQYGP